EYGLQLREKQKAKFIYGVLEKPFRNYYEKADRMKGMTGENLMIILESRLDNVIFRMGIGASRSQARQLVNHGHFLVNGKKVNIPSFIVKSGDVITVKESKTSNKYFEAIKATKAGVIPKWLEFNPEKLEGKILSLPARDDIDSQIAEHMIVELYSK
ncbi:MAG: 30S ribosomal protein S4, partial [Clostridia bacterium]|nr:30S ribosomal protein S4 [Clostridia bacterium]